MDEQNLDQRVSGIYAVLLAAAPILPLSPPGSQCQPPTAAIMTCSRHSTPVSTFPPTLQQAVCNDFVQHWLQLLVQLVAPVMNGVHLLQNCSHMPQLGNLQTA